MEPIVDGLEQQYGERVKFVRLEFDDSVQGPQARKLGVFAHPAFVLIKANGEIAMRFTGEVARAKLEAAIQELLLMTRLYPF